MNWLHTLLVIGLLAAPSLTPAQGPPRGEDPFGKQLYPPELVMSHQQALGLHENQRRSIMQEVQSAQTTFSDVQMRMAGEGEKLGALLKAGTIDEAGVLAQVDRILDLERELKKRQVAMLIRIRNLLTPQQRARLAELREGA